MVDGFFKEGGFYDQIEDEDIDSSDVPFDTSNIDITTQTTSVYNIVEQIRSGEIDLAPDFQRHPNLWNKSQQSRLIESLILGIPLQAFYFDVSVTEDYGGEYSSIIMPRYIWHVVDGLQRLSAIRNFVLDGSLKLRNLEYLKHLEGLTFRDLPPQLQRRINAASLLLYLIRPETNEEIKFNIFKRVNTGGMPLNQQEIRHAILHGNGTLFISKLADLESFRMATQYKISNKRMLDREFINRFLAFYVLDPVESYRAMDLFLNDVIRILNKMTKDKLASIEADFDSAMNLSLRLLGENAFRRFDSINKCWSTKINKALFESVSVALAKLTETQRVRLASISDFEERFKRLFADSIKEDSFNAMVTVGTGNRSKVLARHERMQAFVNECLGGFHDYQNKSEKL